MTGQSTASGGLMRYVTLSINFYIFNSLGFTTNYPISINRDFKTVKDFDTKTITDRVEKENMKQKAILDLREKSKIKIKRFKVKKVDNKAEILLDKLKTDYKQVCMNFMLILIYR